jgi:hypothetical protein
MMHSWPTRHIVRLAILVCGATCCSLAAASSTSSGSNLATCTRARDAIACAVANGSEPWRALRRRPLRIPHLLARARCPRTSGRRANEFSPFGSAYALGSGPAFPMFDVVPPYDPNHEGFVRLYRQPDERLWSVKVLWIVDPHYEGPILVRGRSLRDTSRVRFNYGSPPSTELRVRGAKGDQPAWRQIPSLTRVLRSGCYGYQVDGVGFSSIAVFAARRQ